MHLDLCLQSQCSDQSSRECSDHYYHKDTLELLQMLANIQELILDRILEDRQEQLQVRILGDSAAVLLLECILE